MKQAQSPRYCHTCGHHDERHRLRIFGKRGTACDAPLGHGSTCPCKQWSSPRPRRVVEEKREDKAKEVVQGEYKYF